ncbi:MAG: hypothetical protein U1E59_11800 [Amaricoccus sp.]
MTKRVTVGLEPGITEAHVADLLRDLGAGVVRWRVDSGNVLVLDLDDNAAPGILRKLKGARGVRYAEPDAWQSGY